MLDEANLTTTVDTCLRVCLSNITDLAKKLTTQATTDISYIETSTSHCKLDSVNRPIFHAHAKTYYGSWMRDAYPKDGKETMKRWIAKHFEGDVLEEYLNESDIRRDMIHKIHKLPYPYEGTNSVYFNGSFYYHRSGYPRIAKYEINSKRYSEVIIEGATFRGNQYLFNSSLSYFDLAVDESALWVLFHYDGADVLSVAKLDIHNLTIYDTRNLTLINHTNVANGFVICGVIYLVSSSEEPRSEISVAYDFDADRYRQPNILWTNLYRNSNMIAYNPYDKLIYIYDHGYLLASHTKIKWRN
uniref:Olfactomedin-like domain-containing protein n=1 Tax=Syphacia muris TaxID=451379 RepID=A0A158R5V6_9BILA